MPQQLDFAFMSEADADHQQERVRQIMAEQQLNFGPAVDAYIEEQKAVTADWKRLDHEQVPVDMSGWDAA